MMRWVLIVSTVIIMGSSLSCHPKQVPLPLSCNNLEAAVAQELLRWAIYNKGMEGVKNAVYDLNKNKSILIYSYCGPLSELPTSDSRLRWLSKRKKNYSSLPSDTAYVELLLLERTALSSRLQLIIFPGGENGDMILRVKAMNNGDEHSVREEMFFISPGRVY